VLNWLERRRDDPNFFPNSPTKVTSNHWDIDGFLAVWSLLNAKIAVQHKSELIAAAHLGDFREFEPSWQFCRTALKICALLNHVERSTFCLPFGDLSDVSIEHQIAQRKFDYFLPRFAQWLVKINDYRLMWMDEYTEVLSDLEFMSSPEVSIEEYEDLGLSVIRTPRPLHYYASFSKARQGLVMTIVESKPYVEVEYKYETSVGRLDRQSAPRIDLRPLAEKLTSLETVEGVHWTYDNGLEGGPILRPEYLNHPLTHEERYQSMKQRFEYCPPTSIDPNVVLELVREVLEKHLTFA
jgi:hypothetical protein